MIEKDIDKQIYCQTDWLVKRQIDEEVDVQPGG